MATQAFTVDKPESGVNENVDLPESDATTLSFGTSEIQGMQLSEGGELTISFTDGSALTINNFRALADNEVQLSLEDGSVINSRELFETLAADFPARAISQPVAGEAVAYDIQPGRKYEFDFGDAKPVEVSEQDGALLITFDNDGLLVLHNFRDAMASEVATEINFDGQFLTLREFAEGMEIAVAMNEGLEKPEPQSEVRGEDETASMQDVRTGGEDELAELAQQLSEIEPAAGDEGGGNDGGYGFNSEYQTTPVNPLDDIGPIDPTELVYGLPEFIDELFFIENFQQVDGPPRPLLEVVPAFVYEDSSVTLNVSADPNAGPNVFVTVRITGIPAGWGVNPNGGTFDPATGTWEMIGTPGAIVTGGPTIFPPAESDFDISTLLTNAINTSTTTGLISGSAATFSVTTDAVADDPSITASGGTEPEGTPVAIDIKGFLGTDDFDGSESIDHYEIYGADIADFTFSAGTYLGGGAWSFSPAQIAALTITATDPGFDGSLGLVAKVFTKDTPSDTDFDFSNNTNSAQTQFSVTWTPKIDPPTITVNGGVDDAQVKEDGSVDVTLVAELDPNAEPSEFLTVTVTGFDPAWGTVIAPVGSFNAAGTEWTITLPAGTNLSTVFTFTPAAQIDIDLTGLEAIATATDPNEGGISADSAPDTFNVIVDAVADLPSISASGGTEEEGTPVAINIAGSLGVDNFDGSESIIGYQVLGIPAGFTLNNGTYDSVNDVWNLTSGDLTGLAITGPADFDGTVNLTAKILTEETTLSGSEYDTSDNTNFDTADFTVTWTPDIDPPTITVNGGIDDAQVKEDHSVDVSVVANLSANAEPAEYLTVTITGFDPAWGTVVNKDGIGSFDAAGTEWTITLTAGENLNTAFTFTPDAQSDIDLTGLVATVTAYDDTEGTSASDSDGFNVIVDAVADKPDVTASGGTAEEGTPVAINISGSLGVDNFDGSESITGYQVLGVPAGFTLNNGTYDAINDVWNLTVADLAGLTITANSPGFDGTVNLTAKILTAETTLSGSEYDTSDNTNFDTADFTVIWTPDIDPPTITVNGGVDNAQVKEDNSVDVNVTANLSVNAGANEYLVVTITGFDPAWGTVVNKDGIGSFNAAGTVWTYTAPAGVSVSTEFTFTPDAQSDIDLTGLVASVTAYDDVENLQADGAPDTFNVIVDAVADKPDVMATGGTEEEGTPIAINIFGSLGADNFDGSESITGYQILGVPAGFTLNNGTYNAINDVWNLTAGDLAGLTITANDSDFDGELDLTAKILTAETTLSGNEFDTSDNTNFDTADFTVKWTPDIDPPTITVNGGVDDVQVKEDNSVDVTLVASLSATAEPGEYLVVTVTGFDPAWGAVVNKDGLGSFNVAGTEWTYTAPANTNVSTEFTFTPDAQSDVDLTGLVASVTAYDDVEGLSAAGTPDSFNVIVDAVADKPDITATGGMVEEGNPIDINITASLGADDFDGSEAIDHYEISGVPLTGFHFGTGVGTNLGGGIWSFTPAEIVGLQIFSTDPTFDGSLNLTAKVVNIETLPAGSGSEYDTSDNENFDTDSFTVTWEDDDEPILVQPEVVTVDETGLSPTTSAGDIVRADFGDDGPGSFTINGGFFSSVPLTSNGVPVIVEEVGNSYIGKAGGEIVFALNLHISGHYDFVLEGVLDHPAPTDTSADPDHDSDVITLEFGVTARDKDGDTDDGIITVHVQDDGVKANDDCNIFSVEAADKDFNIVLVLDVSGSMQGDKLALLKSSVSNLLGDFANYNGGAIKVHIVPFSSSAQTGHTFTVTDAGEYADALNFLNDLDANGYTNYEAPLQSAISWLQGASSNDPISGADTYSYFISDGEPNRYVSGSSNSASGNANTVMNQITGSDGTDEVETLQNLSTRVIGVGIGVDDATLARLDVIDSNGDVLDVQDPADLDAALAGTNPLVGIATGNVITGSGQVPGGADDLSNDMPNKVTLISFNGNDVVVDPVTGATIDGDNGTLEIFADGSYTYTLFTTALAAATAGGGSFALNPTSSDVSGMQETITKNGITVTIANAGNFDIKWVSTSDGDGLGIDNLNTSDSTKVWPTGEAFDISFAEDAQTVTLTIAELGNNNDDGNHGLDYVITLADGTTVAGEQQFVPAQIVNGHFTFALDATDYGQPISSIEISSTNAGSYDGASFLLNNVEMTTSATTVDCIGDTFVYTLMDADGDTSTATLELKGKLPILLVGENVDDDSGSTTEYRVGDDSGVITGGYANDILVGDVGGSSQQNVDKDYNIVMMLDVSGSMGNPGNSGSRLYKLIDATENLLNDLGAYNGGEVKVHLVPFSTDAHMAGTFTVTDVAGLNAAISFLNNMPNDGWTNYEAALQSAIDWLESGDPISGAETISYFISDGEPNYYLDNNGNIVSNNNANTSMNQIDGDADGTDEIAQLQSLSDEVIGVGIEVGGTTLTRLGEIDSDGTAINVQNADDLSAALQGTSPLNKLADVGGDDIVGGNGDDLIFGDVLNTDRLAIDESLGTNPGAGWEVFEQLEATAGWDRNDTIAYIRNNAEELATESINTQNETRGGGNDILSGGEGNDTIFGQEGDDLISGGLGNDMLYGGSGADTFLFESIADSAVDTVKDFDSSEGDIIDLSTMLSSTSATQATIDQFVFAEDVGGNTVLSVDLDGSGNPANAVEFAVLEGVTGFNVDDLATSGTLIA